MEAMMTPTPTPTPTVTVGVWRDSEPRLIRTLSGPENLDSYREDGGYAGLTDPTGLPDPADFLAVVDESGLLGRGGAAFPLAVKLKAVRGACGPGIRPVVVANGEEGEPASVKDRWLLRNRPHLVLDGLRLAARAVDADQAYLYVSDPTAAHTARAALEELRRAVFDAGAAVDVAVPIEVVTVTPSYVAGEETAAVRVLNGGPAKPSDKPPRPFESGVAGRPTLVSNVETLANLPFLHRHGSIAYRSLGTSSSPGTFLATVNSVGRPAGLYELPYGLPFTDLLALHGVSPDDLHGALLGGYFAGLMNRQVLDLTLDHETLRRLDAGLGCGAISLLGADDCPVAVAASVLAYFDRENAGQCGSCFNGTAAMSAVTHALQEGAAEQSDVDRLARWSVVLRGRGACGTLDGAANVAASLLREFPEIVERHLTTRSGATRCEPCAGTPFQSGRPFEVEKAVLA